MILISFKKKTGMFDMFKTSMKFTGIMGRQRSYFFLVVFLLFQAIQGGFIPKRHPLTLTLTQPKICYYKNTKNPQLRFPSMIHILIIVELNYVSCVLPYIVYILYPNHLGPVWCIHPRFRKDLSHLCQPSKTFFNIHVDFSGLSKKVI